MFKININQNRQIQKKKKKSLYAYPCKMKWFVNKTHDSKLYYKQISFYEGQL